MAKYVELTGGLIVLLFVVGIEVHIVDVVLGYLRVAWGLNELIAVVHWHQSSKGESCSLELRLGWRQRRRCSWLHFELSNVFSRGLTCVWNLFCIRVCVCVCCLLLLLFCWYYPSLIPYFVIRYRLNICSHLLRFCHYTFTFSIFAMNFPQINCVFFAHGKVRDARSGRVADLHYAALKPSTIDDEFKIVMEIFYAICHVKSASVSSSCVWRIAFAVLS